MASFQREVVIEATPSKVFAVLTDLEHADRVMPDIVKVRRLTDGAFGKGSKWKETRRFKLLGFIPLRASAVIEVTDFAKNKRYTTVADDGCNWAAYTFRLASAGRGKTRVELEAEFKLVGKHAAHRKAEARAARMADWCAKVDGDLLQRLKAAVDQDG